MVVVFVTHNYPRRAGDLPGLFLHPLALALRDRGHDVRVVAPADRGSGGREPLDGIPVRRVRYAPPARETLAYEGRMQEAVRTPGGLWALVRLIGALRRGASAEAGGAGDTVVHAHWWIPAGLALPKGIPGLVTLHGTDGRILERSRLGRALGRQVLRRARVVSAVSPELAQVADRVSGRDTAVRHVQAMPVDSAAIPWSRGGGGLLVVGRLTRQKRVDLAIGAAAALAAEGNPAPLTIIGDGPERASLEAAASGSGEAPVRFLGHLPRAEALRALETADAMLFTAEREGFGLAAIEALMAGVPVVACVDGGGVVSALGRYGGGVVSQGNAVELARAVRRASEPDFRDAARRAGMRWREELAPARVASVFEGWYREALGA